MTQRRPQVVRYGIGKRFQFGICCLEFGGSLGQSVFGFLAGGDVAENGCEEVSICGSPVGDGNLYREFFSVLVPRDQLERLSDDSGLTGGKEALKAELVRLREPFGHEQGQRPTERFLRRIAENVLGRPVEIDDIAKAVRRYDRVACRFGNCPKLLAAFPQNRRERLDLRAQQPGPAHDEEEQQGEDDLKLLADRLEYLGRVDLDHHPEAEIAHRAVGRDHVLLAVIACDDGSGLAAQRASHRQGLAGDVGERDREHLGIEPLREALKPLSVENTQAHVAGRAHSGHVPNEARQHGQRLLGEHRADLSCGVAHRDAVAEQECAVPYELRLLRRRERRRQLGRLRECPSARDDPALRIAIGDRAEALLEETVDDGSDVFDVRAVVAASTDDAQVADDRGTRGGNPGVDLAEFNQVPEHVGATRQRRKDVVADQRLHSALQDCEARDAGDQGYRDQDRRADEGNPIVFPGDQRRAGPRRLLAGGLETEREENKTDGRMDCNAGKDVLRKQQRSAHEVPREAEQADRSDSERQQLHRGARPRATHARSEDERGSAHQKAECRARRHPARFGVGVVHPGMQPGPIDAEFDRQEMLGEDEGRKAGDRDAERRRDTPVHTCVRNREQQRNAG